MDYFIDKNDNVYEVLGTYRNQFLGNLNSLRGKRTLRQFIEDIQNLTVEGI